MKISTIGRIVYSVPFLVFGTMHLMKAPMMAPMVPAIFPGGVIWVYLTGVAMLAAALSLISGKFVTYACIGLTAMLGIFIVTVHIPHLNDPQMGMMAMIGLLKDTGLAGAALFIGGKSCDCSKCGDCKDKKTSAV